MSKQPERRKAKRRQILEHFSFYIQIPKLGPARHQVLDLSEFGIGFSVESLGGVFTLNHDEKVDLHLYLNQSLFLPLKIQVMRQIQSPETQQVGAVFLDTKSNQYQTYLSLVKFLDQLSEFGSENKD
jgi:hypothetical protein